MKSFEALPNKEQTSLEEELAPETKEAVQEAALKPVEALAQERPWRREHLECHAHRARHRVLRQR